MLDKMAENIRLTRQEGFTIIAALHYWQQTLDQNGGPSKINQQTAARMLQPSEFIRYRPLTSEKINDLCDYFKMLLLKDGEL